MCQVMDIAFKSKRILVTGAASGIGRGIAMRLARAGGKVIGVDKSQENLEALKQESCTIEVLSVDLTAWQTAQDAIKPSLPVDMLVNCAGIADIGPITEVQEINYQRTFDVNVKATIAVTQLVVSDLLARGCSGSVVTISSQASQAALLNHTLYAASKGALDAFTRTLALEVGPKNIRVNCVNPTVVMTPLGKLAWSEPTVRDAMLAKIPLRRFAEIDDVADAVLFLLSDKSSMITGHCLAVDGGFLAC